MKKDRKNLKLIQRRIQRKFKLKMKKGMGKND